MRSQVSEALGQLAQSHGLLLSYCAVDGRERFASTDSIMAVLRAMGAPLARPEDAQEALRARNIARWQLGVAPVVLMWLDTPGPVELRVQVPVPSHARADLTTETGEHRAWDWHLESHPFTEDRIDGRSFRTHSLPLPFPVATGRHRLTVEVGAQVLQTNLLVAPRRTWAFDDRRWGLFAPTYALWSRRSRGIGSLNELGDLMKWVGSQGGQMVGTLPLTASFLSQPFDPSPYAPVSRLFWNELFLDLESLGLGSSPGERAELSALRAELQAMSEVDYRRCYQLLRAVVQPMADNQLREGAMPQDFLDFATGTPEVVGYARFRGAMEKLGPSWRQWPDRMRRGNLVEGDWDPATYRLHLFSQWKMFEQLGRLSASGEAAGVGLALDVPLGVHSDGYDAWAEQESWIDDLTVGAPPDAFFTTGQNWGFAPADPERMRADGFDYLRRCLDRQCALATCLRIDHVMWMHRTFVIPTGMRPSDGLYLRYPTEELYALLTLASTRHRCMVAGEDLGTVPQQVRDTMADHGVSRLWVLQFEALPDRSQPTTPIPRNAVASLNTHDMSPFAGFWYDDDIELRADMGLSTAQEGAQERADRALLRDAIVHGLGTLHEKLGPDPSLSDILRVCLEHLAASDARALLVNLEDLWLERRAQNVPGDSEIWPNWRRKAAHSLEDIQSMPAVQALLQSITAIRKENPQ